MRPTAGLLFVVIPALVAGCSSEDGTAVQGELVYREPFADGNTFACATCHALDEPAADGLRRPGHPIGDAVARATYKDGSITELREAVNTCVTEWMNAEPFAAGDDRWVALESFLASMAPAGEAPPVDIQITPPPADLTGGDATRGQALFNGSCVVCHGMDASGTQRAPSLTGRELPPEYIAERVRLSGRDDSPTYDGLTGGVMPFWGADRLSDAELLDIVEFVHQNSLGEPIEPPDPPDPPDPPPPSGCASTHPKVGVTGTFVTRFHGVTGTARIVDDCTIALEGFSYDGTGITVEIYGGVGGDFDGGVSLSDNLVRSTPYQDETLFLTLPEGVTLDDFDGISVWCVAVGVSFGDAPLL